MVNSLKIVRKKLLPKYFLSVKDRKKNFEIRKDEDNIQAGDLLVLEEWAGHYTGAGLRRTVKYVLRNAPEYGLKEGFCIIGW